MKMLDYFKITRFKLGRIPRTKYKTQLTLKYQISYNCQKSLLLQKVLDIHIYRLQSYNIKKKEK